MKTGVLAAGQRLWAEQLLLQWTSHSQLNLE